MNANDWPSGRSCGLDDTSDRDAEIARLKALVHDERRMSRQWEESYHAAQLAADKAEVARDAYCSELTDAWSATGQLSAELQLSVSLADVVGGMREEIARLKAELERIESVPIADRVCREDVTHDCPMVARLKAELEAERQRAEA